jgi:acyl-CoA thioester hydrolase
MTHHRQARKMSRLPAEHRSAFAHFHKIDSRWNDNDVFGHVNNVVYYSYFDTAVNAFLIREGVLDLQLSKIVGLVVETQCRYFSSIAFPDTIYVGLRLAHLGTSSIRYEAAVFRNDEDVASAQGYFIHVYVDRATNRPVPMPQALIDAAGLLKVH